MIIDQQFLNMNKKTILLLLLALTTMAVRAQGTAKVDTAKTDTAQQKKEEIKNPVFLHGTVADSFTKAAIPDVFMTMMREDSTVVDTMHVYTGRGYTWGIGRTSETSGYYLPIKREAARYILKFEHPNYETTFADVEVKNVGKRRRDVEGPKVYMKKTANAHHHEGGELDEVVVKATKVKMVWKGDTLVYNADAFNVPEGSMLDALIKQLPGVELKENGEIFVNGKKIDNLTLNGADFFKGKNKIMLENLPYFTVKNVEVYNKQTPENKYYGINDEDKKEYTMDVVLKREYSIGGTANFEAGLGPTLSSQDDGTSSSLGGTGGGLRYKLKGFGLRFSDHTRAVLFGGLNNINETTSFDQEQEQYKDRSHQAGDRHFRQVGGMFTYLGEEGKLNNSTEFRAEWKDDSGDTRTNSETFLNEASTYGQSESHNRSRPVSLALKNTFQMNVPFHVYLRAQLDYQRNRYDSEGWSLSTGDAQHTDSINLSHYSSSSKSDRLSGQLWGDIGKRLPSGDNISLSLNGNFSKTFNPESNSLNDYTYYKLGTHDLRDRRTLSPAYNYSLSLRGSYRYSLKNLSITPYYGISPSRNHNDREEYLRDSIDYILDATNTYETTTQEVNHEAGVTMSYNKPTKKEGYFGIYGQMEVDFDHQKMRYDQQSITRNYTFLNSYVGIYYQSNKGVKRFNLNYNPYTQTPGVTDLLSRPNTSDPLNIFLGNPDLKMQTTHRIYGNYSVRRDSINQTLAFSADANFVRNSIERGYTYDLTTGIRTYRPENIKGGNWSISGTFTWNRAIDKKKLWNIGNEWRIGYDKNTNFASTNASSPLGGTREGLNRVGNFTLRYKPSLRYQKEKLTLSLKGEMQYRNIHRSLELSDALPTDIWDFSYGFYAQYILPLDFTIDTDLQMHSRRGYADAEMNDNRLYWDASLTKSFKAGRWVMKLRGYDLLGQVSNLRYSVNSQGRTETWNNTLRRYAMLSISYRFSKMPKKK